MYMSWYLHLNVYIYQVLVTDLYVSGGGRISGLSLSSSFNMLSNRLSNILQHKKQLILSTWKDAELKHNEMKFNFKKSIIIEKVQFFFLNHVKKNLNIKKK